MPSRTPCLRVDSWRRGFTLVELLVVIAITVVLMGLLLGPLSQSFQLTARGRAMIAAQDNARSAMAQITRDIQDAMVVYDGLPTYMYGYTDLQPFKGHPHPSGDSQPALVMDPQTGRPIEYRNAVVDLVLPRARYYCTGFQHYLRDDEVAPNQAVTECPRHPGSPVESRPIQPLQPSGNRVRYFIGLRQPFNPNPLDPGLPGAQSRLPHYMNPSLFSMSGTQYSNPYVLYRAEFNTDPSTLLGRMTPNWQVRDASGVATGQLNPNFFYDPAFAQNWKSLTVAVISPINTDMVRWIQEGENGPYLPQPMTRFSATPVESETLTPTRETVTTTSEGRFVQAARVPMQYVAENGHWTGPTNDMTLPLAPVVLVGPTLPPNNLRGEPFAIGPRFQIYDAEPGPEGPRMAPVFDSALPVGVLPRQRLFTWDSSRGIVNFALRAETTRNIRRPDESGLPDEVPYSLTLKGPSQNPADDTRTLPLVSDLSKQDRPLPASFGKMLADPLLGPTVHIVPGSEIVQVLDRNGQPVRTFERAGWIGTGSDQVVAQADLEPEQYVIDYSNGLIMFSDRDPNLAGLPVHVRYQMHTNKATDVVRVSYATRELFTLTVGLLQFEPGTGQAQEIQLTNRLRLRNLSR